MNRKEWLKQEKKNWEWRNKAVKYFNGKKGDVIHHLMETEEQRNFNNLYYERWGFDLNGEMKYCSLMNYEDHLKYHRGSLEWRNSISRSLTGRKLSKEHIKNIVESRLKRKPKKVIEYKYSIERRSKMSDRKKGENNNQYGKHWYNNGIIAKPFFENEVPIGWFKGRKF